MATKILIASTVLGSDAASITFSDIPQTFDDLLLVCSIRTTAAGDGSAYGRFNGDTGANYSRRFLYGDGASAASSSSTGQTSLAAVGYGSYSANTASTFGSSEALIPNYRGSTAKTTSLTAVNESNVASGSVFIAATAGLWSGTAAITSIELAAPASANFVAGSSFYLYGLKH